MTSRAIAVPLLALLAAMPAMGSSHRVANANAKPVARVAANTIGNLDAPVSIVLFADLECPFSAATFPVIEQLAKVDPTHIHLIVKQFPLSIHSGAEFAAEAVEAAGAQGHYFDMANLIQANQKQMSRDQYRHYAELLHLDLPRFTRDLDEHRYRFKVESDHAEGNAVGVTATPTLLINGHTYSGSQDPGMLTSAIQQALIKAGKSSVVAPMLASVNMNDLARNPTALRGASEAPVTIVEFTDFQCPFCRRASQALAQYFAQNGTPVRFVFRNFPLDFHEHAELAAEAALAARAQGKFWPMHDLLFANQKDLSRDALINLASELHLDVARFANDLDTGKYKAEIAADRALGVQADVNGTPAFFINGRRVDGAITLPELNQVVALAAQDPPHTTLAGAENTTTLPRTATVVAGDKDAPVTLTWFSDVETASARPMGQLVRQLANDSPAGAKSKIRVVFKYHALPGHDAAPYAHLALIYAAQQGKFWELYDAVTAMHFTSDTANASASIIAAAKSVGLDGTQVHAAIDSGLDASDLRADTEEAEWRGVRGVPTVYVNENRVDGLQSPAIYTSYIKKALGLVSTSSAALQVVGPSVPAMVASKP